MYNFFKKKRCLAAVSFTCHNNYFILFGRTNVKKRKERSKFKEKLPLLLGK